MGEAHGQPWGFAGRLTHSHLEGGAGQVAKVQRSTPPNCQSPGCVALVCVPSDASRLSTQLAHLCIKFYCLCHYLKYPREPCHHVSGPEWIPSWGSPRAPVPSLHSHGDVQQRDPDRSI